MDNTTDLWCPNCSQPVRPRESTPRRAWLVGMATWFLLAFLAAAVVAVFALLGLIDWETYRRIGTIVSIVAAGIGIRAGRSWAREHRVRWCPMCGTHNVQAPRTAQ